MRNPIPRIDAKWALVLGAFLLLGTSARAESTLITCPLGTEATHYQPGITNVPQQVNVTADAVLGPCVSLTPGIVSAKVHTTAKANLSCSLNLGSTPSQLDITWNDGTKSVASGQTLVNVKATGQLVLVLTGKITGGRFKNATIERTLTLLQTDLLGCFTPEGVTDVSGAAMLTVVGGS
ncbi:MULTISPECIES: hypothetical protein [unclassified Corallococcus]|uniref:hypothetical protein n=1 Tax=unclassified Corallococcus TaxID=2685029 RepID=UPI001A8E347D|nr:MULTISPECIES: hypothetical protein [unclassified Corallococcus]MBN9681844.1 hypothetical protein [Corallococcus sp. NCSPR001]WAS86586.1 hypothetical protein O0N60_06325 [Corallococcus sp. NCRR]